VLALSSGARGRAGGVGGSRVVIGGMRRAATPLFWALLVGGAAWLLLTAVFLPWLNPLIRGGAFDNIEVRSLLGRTRVEILISTSSAQQHLDAVGSWPQELEDFYYEERSDALTMEIPGKHRLRYRFGDAFPIDSGLRGSVLEFDYDPATRRWSCAPGEPAPPARWIGGECPGASGRSLANVLLAALLAAVLLLCVVLLWLQLLDPRLRALARAPKRLRRTAPAELRGLNWRLHVLRRRAAALAAAAIVPEDWTAALEFSRQAPAERAQRLALRIGARSQASRGWPLPGEVFEWSLPGSLPLALERLLVWLPAPALGPRAVVEHLRAVSTGQDVLLVLSPNAAADTVLQAYASDPANLCLALDSASLGEWLLHPEPSSVLVNLAARQLRVSRISPYQTRGGVTRPSAFFGREALLARVLNREPGNYLLVGGRQLGKTSLMKAIERRFEAHPRVLCRYLSLRDHRLGPLLAHELKQPADTPIDALILALSLAAKGRRLLLLIDETDLFLRHEAAQGYPQLVALRAISEGGLCHFMLAGFWDLYEATALDFASPIRNFGEVIRLGALEPEACLALATEPLRSLGIGYANELLPARIVEACGGRANLVAICCQQLIEGLESGERRISAAAVERVLAGEAVADALAGWSRLSPDPRDCALDRSIVYRIARAHAHGEHGLALAAWLRELAEVGVDVPAESVRHAFARLGLAYVLLREDDAEHWRFAVPLLAKQFRGEEVEVLLEGELRGLRAQA
jgi:hypothetical protein